MIYQISDLHVSGIRNIKHHTLHDLFVENSAKTTLPPTRKHQQQTSKQSNKKFFNLTQLQKADKELTTQSTKTCQNQYSKTPGKF